MVTSKEKNILRELAKHYVEIASDEINREREARIRQINGLLADRPPVWIDEIPWHEMDIDAQLTPQCESKAARKMESYFRAMLFRWKYFQADMVAQGSYYIDKAYECTGIGVEIKETTISTDSSSNIVSHHYEDQLDTEDKVEQLTLPVVTAHPEQDELALEQASEILGGIMPIKLRGSGIYHAPWDMICMYRGVEPILTDIIERPELLHRTIAKFTDYSVSMLEQFEELGLLEYDTESLHCTPPYCDALPAPDYDGGRVRMKDVWFRGMAQMFTTVSPAMWDEFELQYMSTIANRCGLSYYGCCEPLNNIIPILKKVPNMRKLGISPWADIRSCAEQLGGGYVFARKPNPAHVVGSFSKDIVRKEIMETLDVCAEFGCPCEFVLKDISTVSYKPQNLIDWNNTVRETIDMYYR